jgi:hypothetical protein
MPKWKIRDGFGVAEPFESACGGITQDIMTIFMNVALPIFSCPSENKRIKWVRREGGI